MTASFVYDGDREVATVGILTDLRERIRRPAARQRDRGQQSENERARTSSLEASPAGAVCHVVSIGARAPRPRASSRWSSCALR